VDECKPLPTGALAPHRRGPRRVRTPPGRVVQLDPIKPTLNPPGTKSLKLNDDKTAFNYASILLSNSTCAGTGWWCRCTGTWRGGAVQVGPMKPKFKAPGTKRLKLKCDILLSNVALKFNMRRYSAAVEAAAARGGRRGQRPQQGRALQVAPIKQTAWS